jgi:hypothetical protein
MDDVLDLATEFASRDLDVLSAGSGSALPVPIER